jgi:3-oxoacyl-[acyl-carrier protein] reductase
MIGYLSAKSALVGILKDLYKEVKIDRITVNAIAPEFVATSLHKDLPDKIISFLKERIPSNTPDEVADTISFLCGEETKNVTGMSYTVKKLEVTPL